MKVLWKIVRDKLRVGALDFVFEVLWTVFSIITVLLLWNGVVSKVPTGWTPEMLFVFALILEIYYVVRSYIRDVVWAYGEFFVEGWIEPFLKPKPYLYVVISRNDGGYIAASVVKTIVLLGALIYFFEGWWKGLLAFILGMVFYTGYEMLVVGVSLLLMESGRFWDLLYSFLGYLVEIPADFFRGFARFFVTVLTPVFFAVTFPTKAVFGILDELPLLVVLSTTWLLIGYFILKKSVEHAQAYGG